MGRWHFSVTFKISVTNAGTFRFNIFWTQWLEKYQPEYKPPVFEGPAQKQSRNCSTEALQVLHFQFRLNYGRFVVDLFDFCQRT